MSLATAPHLPVRAFNTLCDGLWPRGRRGDFDPDRLEERARRTCGLLDLGPDEYREGLEVLCRSAEQDADLNAFGRVVMQIQIHNALVTRLLRIEARARTPEVFEAPLPPPLIIVGLPRSGTTFLHRMLSLAPDARALTTWEVRRPLPDRGIDLRRAMAALQIGAFKMAMPGVDAKHRIDLDEPEECMFLLDSSLCSAAFWIFGPIYGYVEWLLDQDLRPAYRVYREHLQMFAAGSPGRRLVLKAPFHTPYLEELIGAVPEAMVVQTHRDPVKITSSVNSLFASYHGAACRDLDVGRMARVNLDLLTRMARGSMEARAHIGEDRVLDVSHAALVEDPIGVVRRIHSHHGLPFDGEYEATLEAYLERRPRRRFGKHEYSADEFGMTDAEIAAEFTAYVERFVEAAV